MRDEQFNASIDATLDAAKTMLTRKSAGYSNEEDRLHNFRVGAALNGLTMEQVCWGMATKHIISIRDMVQSGQGYSPEVWDEKIGDAINYLAILKAITVYNDQPRREQLKDLREKLTGTRDRGVPYPESAEMTITRDGNILTRNENVYSQGFEHSQTPSQRDLDSIKRVADKLK